MSLSDVKTDRKCLKETFLEHFLDFSLCFPSDKGTAGRSFQSSSLHVSATFPTVTITSSNNKLHAAARVAERLNPWNQYGETEDQLGLA